LFEAAEGGTLFLDEIGEISPAMQVKILRTLQEREVRRIGENISRPIDIRIISATNRKLIDEISTGRFRKDLYYRLRVIELTVPPLRERTEDIIPLARYFLDSAASRTERKRLALSSKAAKLLLLYNWPGNVRELENVVEYAVALTTGNEIESTDLPEELSSVPLPGDQSIVRTLKQIEQDYIQSVLDHVDGNKSKAAEALGIGIATLYRKLKQ
jgi:transcriptional regulator with PAS, ATPase and Fis domain